MTTLHPTSTRTGGFTLIELLIVKSIIAILIGFLIPWIGFAEDVADDLKQSPALADLGEELSSLLPNIEQTSIAALQILEPQAHPGGELSDEIRRRLYERMAWHEEQLQDWLAKLEDREDELTEQSDKDLFCMADGSVRSLLETVHRLRIRLYWLSRGGPGEEL